MTLPTSALRFVLQPAVDPAPHQAEIDTAVMAYRAILNTAVAKQPNYAAFLAGDGFFRQLSNGLAGKLGIVGVEKPEAIEEAWRFNLAAVGLASAGITGQAVREQLGALEGCATLASRIAYTATDPAKRGTATLNSHVVQAVEHVLTQFWWLLGDTALDGTGTKVQNGAEQNHNYIDHAYGAHLKFNDLQRDFPVWAAKNKLDGYNIWWFNMYRLALQLLGYQPAN